MEYRITSKDWRSSAAASETFALASMMPKMSGSVTRHAFASRHIGPVKRQPFRHCSRVKGSNRAISAILERGFRCMTEASIKWAQAGRMGRPDFFAAGGNDDWTRFGRMHIHHMTAAGPMMTPAVVMKHARKVTVFHRCMISTQHFVPSQ